MSDRLRSPFADLRSALEQPSFPHEGPNGAGPSVRIDAGRWRRTGIPEIVHAEAKPASDVAAALRRLAQASGRALASRVSLDMVVIVAQYLEPEFAVERHDAARALVVSKPGATRPRSGGVVGVLAAGTSDIPFAAEASLVAAEMGARVLEAWDVGVAGLHRLVGPLEGFAVEGVDVIVVTAGMDGALPSVVAGLVDVPVIGLPTSIGYGLGAGGVGALTTMLQSCAPGIAVVNIDNGVGAGATAALIANRAGALRASGGG
jgi:NCAIR mutase (PurE)-related protein